MDGGRILRALLARNRSRVRAIRLAARTGRVFAVLLGIIGVLHIILVILYWLIVNYILTVVIRRRGHESTASGTIVTGTAASSATTKPVWPSRTAVSQFFDRWPITT